MAYYSRPEELLVAFKDLLEANKGLLGLAYVATQEENLIPEYPAVQVSMGNLQRGDHGTQRFLLLFEASFWIYHANYEATHATRSIEDMKLATNVVRFLHLRKNRALNDGTEDRIIGGSGLVIQEISGMLSPERGNRIITTRLIWQGQSQVNYEDS